MFRLNTLATFLTTRSVCEAVRGERRHSEKDHQEKDASLPP